MNSTEILYMFEHKMLPMMIYRNRQNFIGAIVNDKNVLVRVLNEVFERENTENPYQPDDFKVDVDILSEEQEIWMVKVVFPEPEEAPLCHAGYAIFEPSCKKLVYFTLEKSAEGTELCSWSEEGVHTKHSSIENEEKAIREKCMQLFAELTEKEEEK